MSQSNAATTYKRIAIIGSSALAIFAAIGIGSPSSAATLPATASLAPAVDNDGPFYFWRGMDMQTVASKKGMLVARVQVGSPAAHVGLKPGDIVSTLDGMPVNTARSLALAIADHCCGPTVRLRVWRHHHVRVVELPSAIS